MKSTVGTIRRVIGSDCANQKPLMYVSVNMADIYDCTAAVVGAAYHRIRQESKPYWKIKTYIHE